ncbi:MarR family transcriptional regulator [Novosphingobium sp.]|uniref:MarR family transcriptional regulator n=1 Tax=Novosphingobium sp. TaxID=1874826 RepID=UPI00286E291B|nr:MarR family transcriptional regulator [Novosphingobium sp.]
MGTLLHRVEFAEGETVAGMRSHAQRLIAMAGDLLALARELEGRPAPAATNGSHDEAAMPTDRRVLGELARNAYRARRLRNQYFSGTDLFGEPAWDLLLDLFINACEGKRVPVTSACIGAAVPTTTALRWLTILESRELVEREADSSDARRIFVRLTPRAQTAMSAYFARASQDMRSNEPRLPLIVGS